MQKINPTASDALPVVCYDGDMNTYLARNKNRARILLIDKSVYNRTIAFRLDGMSSDHFGGTISFYDESENLLRRKSFGWDDREYWTIKIPDNAVKMIAYFDLHVCEMNLL